MRVLVQGVKTFATGITPQKTVTLQTNFRGGQACAQKPHKDRFLKAPPQGLGLLEQKQVENIVKKVGEGWCVLLGEGYNSQCWKLNDQAVKVVKKDTHNCSNDATYDKEAFALRYLKNTGTGDSQELVDLIRHGNMYYLVTTFAKGRTPSMQTPFKDVHIEDLSKKLTKMDLNGLVHYDIQPLNTILDKDVVRLIDFGAFNVLCNNGRYLNPSRIPTAEFKSELGLIEDLTSASPQERIARTAGKKLDDLNRTDNPHLAICSNYTNFEYRTLYSYLGGYRNHPGLVETKGPKESKEFYINYLKQKSQNYHKVMAEFLEGIDPESTDANALKKAIAHEKLAQRLLLEPSKEVLEIEIGKTQARFAIAERNFAPRTAVKIYNDFMEKLSLMSQNSQGDVAVYAKNTLESLGNFKWVNSYIAKNIPENAPENSEYFEKPFELLKKTFTMPE